MKKVLYLLSLLVVTVMPNITSAHYSGETDPSICSIGIRVEVSKDNGATWYSYDSSDASSLGTGYTLKVAPGDSIKMRIKMWNDGSGSCLVQANGVKTGFEYLDGLSGTFDNLDEDGDTVSMLPSPGDISNITVPVSGSTPTSGYQSASINATVKSDAPENASMTLNYTVGMALGGPMTVGSSSKKSFTQKIVEAFIPTVRADGDGTATSGLRVEVGIPVAGTTPVTVQELPKTGQNAYLFLIPIAFILPAYFWFRKINSKHSK